MEIYFSNMLDKMDIEESFKSLMSDFIEQNSFSSTQDEGGKMPPTNFPWVVFPRGRLNQALHWYVKANNKCMRNMYDPKQFSN